MKYKNNYLFLLFFIMMVTFFASCKKQKDCVKYTKENKTLCTCVGNKNVETHELYDAFIAHLKANKYSIKYVDDCK